MILKQYILIVTNIVHKSGTDSIDFIIPNRLNMHIEFIAFQPPINMCYHLIMSRFYFIRHADAYDIETGVQLDDYSLNNYGRIQALQLS